MTAPPVETWDELVGGVPRLALWADENPGEFYMLAHQHGFTLTLHQWVELLNTLSAEARIAALDHCVAEGLLTRSPLNDGKVLYRFKQKKRRSNWVNPAWKHYQERLQAYAMAVAAAEAHPDTYPWPQKPKPPPFPRDHRGDVTYLIHANEKTPKVAASEVLDVQPPAKETERDQ